MRTVLILAALGWAMSLPWMALFSYIALIVAAIAILWGLSVSIERRAVPPWPGGNTINHNYVAALESMAADTEAEMETLRGEIERLRSVAGASEPDPRTALYRRVGLNENAPPWLILAARRAYRAKLHPDRYPEHHKREADLRFKLAEATFEEIAASRS